MTPNQALDAIALCRTRRAINALYAKLLRQWKLTAMDGRWAGVNSAIMRRYGQDGLDTIKRNAWKEVERDGTLGRRRV